MFKNRSVLFSWVLSYILILFIPIIFGIAVYLNAEKTVEDETNQLSRAMLEQNQQTMDDGLADIGRIINQIEINKRFKQLMALNQNNSNNNYYDDNVIQAIDDFKYYRVLTSFISDYFIYFKNIDKVLISSALTDQQIFYKSKIQSGNMMPQDEWAKLLRGDLSGRYITLGGNETSGGSSINGLMYSETLPLNQTQNSKAVIVIFLNYHKIQDIFQSMQTVNNGWGIILDKDNNVLFSTKDMGSLPPEINYNKLSDEKILYYMTIAGESVVVSYVKSKETGWKFISITPYSIFWQKVEFIRLLTIISALLCIVLGMLISFFLARRNYMPVNDLLSILINKSRKTISKGFNEYKFIQEAVQDTINENKSSSERLKQQNNVLRSVFLEKLLKGKMEDEHYISSALPMYDLKFDTDSFAVVSFYIMEFDSLFDSRFDNKTSEEKLAFVRFIITSTFEDLATKENNVYTTEVNEMSICLVNFRNPEYGIQELRKVTNEAYDFIRSNFKIKFIAAVSDIHKTYFGIPESYQEALSTIEYQIAMESSEIACYGDIKGLGKYNYSIETENRLINCIKSGDFEKSEKALDAIFESAFSKNSLPNSLLKCMMFGLANTIFKAMMEVSYICGEEFIHELHIEDRLLKCSKVNEMKQQMITILKKVCQYIHENKKGKREQIVDGIIDFIENRFSDVNLSVAVIAEKFDLTPAYLTKLFKEQMSEGVFDYICKVRIEKAKLLLKSNDDLSIKDIAEKVGYFNSNIFIRAFKKHEGITPGIYKIS